MRETKECLFCSLGGAGLGHIQSCTETIIPFVKWLILSSSSRGIMHNVLKIKQEQLLEGSPFLSCFKPLPQSKAKCEAIDMKMKLFLYSCK